MILQEVDNGSVTITTFLQLALLLLIILLAAKLTGYLSVRLGQPSVLGELLVGILLGPSVLDILLLTLALVVMLAFDVAAELLGGMAAITVAFIAGLMMARSGEKERVEHGVHALAYGLFVPIFFVNIGLSVNARTLGSEMVWFALVITLVAILGKWIGAGTGQGGVD